MTTKFNVGDTVLIKGIVESINIETTDNKPIYLVRIKGAGTYEAYGVRVKEDIIEVSSEEDRCSCYNCYWNCAGTCKNEQSGYYKMSIKSVMSIPPYNNCSKYEAYEGDG